MKRKLWVLLALSVVVSSQAPSGAAPDRYAKARAEVKGVPCEADFGPGTSANLKTLVSQPWTPDLRTGELDVEGDLLLAHLFQSPGGFVAADISNPLKTSVLSVFRLEGFFTYDVKMTDDGTTALLGFDDGVASAGVAVVDIRDPKHPKLMSSWMSDRPGALQNGHMLYTANIHGTDWVFVAPNDSTGVWVLKLNGPPGKRELEFVTQSLLVEGGPLGPHDMYVGFDEKLETWVLYAADGYEGWLAYDVNDPAAPVFLGGFLHPSTGYTHTIQSGWVKGRRIVATVEEVGVNMLKIYDATDLLRPVLLGVWSQEEGTGPIDAQHNMQIVKNRLYVAHYEHGLFVFDLAQIAKDATPIVSEIEPAARYQPEGTEFWDVVLQDGLVYGGKFTPGGGFDVIGFGCLTPGDHAQTSTG